jgi:hypothetical protein
MVRVVVHIGKVWLGGNIFELEGIWLRDEFGAGDAVDCHRIGIP